MHSVARFLAVATPPMPQKVCAIDWAGPLGGVGWIDPHRTETWWGWASSLSFLGHRHYFPSTNRPTAQNKPSFH